MTVKNLIENYLIEDDYEIYRRTYLRRKRTHPQETNDCFVIAIAIVCDVPYVSAHKAVEDVYGRKVACGTTFSFNPGKLNKCLAKFGKKALLVKDKRVKTSKSTRHLKDGRYLCNAPKHAFAVVNGVVEDWSIKKQIKIHQVFKVVDKNSKTSIDFEPIGHYYVNRIEGKTEGSWVLADGMRIMSFSRLVGKGPWEIEYDDQNIIGNGYKFKSRNLESAKKFIVKVLKSKLQND